MVKQYNRSKLFQGFTEDVMWDGALFGASPQIIRSKLESWSTLHTSECLSIVDERKDHIWGSNLQNYDLIFLSK